jgi:hypothetical protein
MFSGQIYIDRAPGNKKLQYERGTKKQQQGTMNQQPAAA